MSHKKNLIKIAIIVLVLVIGIDTYSLLSASKPIKIVRVSNAAHHTNGIYLIKNSAALGTYLSDLNSRTLYTYSADSKGVSNCTGSCLLNWPAYEVNGAVVNLPKYVGTIKRTDNGQVQFTYKGLPLYYFVGDSTPGQITGNGVDGFNVATP
jgi:predicted lipoprotein with Yx(FWY)xxD motif